MKRIFIIFLSLLNISLFASENDVLGQWITEKGASGNQIIVKLYKTSENKFNGKIVGLTIPKYLEGEYKGLEKMDLKNKKENLRGRKLVGIDFVYSFKFNANNNTYENGVIYNPENGKEYHSSMKLNNDGTLTVKGSIDKKGLIGKKQIWRRYK